MLTEEQFSYLAKKYMDTVFRLALHYTKSRSESDDITQEVLIKLYRTDKPFESEDHVRHWLIRVTVNECKRTFLSPWKRTEPIDDYLGIPNATVRTRLRRGREQLKTNLQEANNDV